MIKTCGSYSAKKNFYKSFFLEILLQTGFLLSDFDGEKLVHFCFFESCTFFIRKAALTLLVERKRRLKGGIDPISFF